ncbi:MAG TPA: helix-turn-helix domain-containing protein [Kofleriaceae bacterium]|jgi:AcrR family transcriptional regulator|nr:helix-turn-helix domain-containing protein [Kofleriaceae bacterium]
MTAKRSRPRVRRSPEEARSHILDAADRVFRDHLPDAVGLREVAAAAGVSHGLVTHYFATYERLVAAVIARRLDVARTAAFAHLAQMTFAPDEVPLLSVLVDLLEDRTLVRLLVWSLMSGRSAEIVGRDGQAGRLIDGMVARFAVVGTPVPRARLEFAAMVALASITGWAVLGEAMDRAFGRAAPVEIATLRTELQRMLRAYVAAP